MQMTFRQMQVEIVMAQQELNGAEIGAGFE
jgi:hypothetical protein